MHFHMHVIRALIDHFYRIPYVCIFMCLYAWNQFALGVPGPV